MSTVLRSGPADYVAAANYRQTGGGRHAGLILLHGLGGDLNQTCNYTAGIIDGAAAIQLVADAREHGLTRLTHPRRLSFDVMADDISSLADAVNLPTQRVIIGVSMGAGTALRMALRNQTGLRGLILIRPAWLHQPHPDNLAPFALIAALLAHNGPIEGKQIFTQHRSYQAILARSASTAASLLEQFDKPWALERVARLIDMPANTPYTDPLELARITVPTLVIGAPQDPIHPPSIAQRWTELIPPAGYAALPARDDNPDRHHRDLQLTIDGFLATL